MTHRRHEMPLCAQLAPDGRVREILPQIPKILSGTCIANDRTSALAVDWRLRDGGMLRLRANLTDTAAPMVGRLAGRMIFSTHPGVRSTMTRNELAPWSVTWLLERGDGGR